jgi:hypothetical protein
MPDGNRDYGLKATLKEPLPQLALARWRCVLAVAAGWDLEKAAQLTVTR